MSLNPLAKNLIACPIGARASDCTREISSIILARVSAGRVSAIRVRFSKGASIVSSPRESAHAVRPSRFCCFFKVLSACHCCWVSGNVLGSSNALKVEPSAPSGPLYILSMRYVLTLRTSVPPRDWVHNAVWQLVGALTADVRVSADLSPDRGQSSNPGTSANGCGSCSSSS